MFCLHYTKNILQCTVIHEINVLLLRTLDSLRLGCAKQLIAEMWYMYIGRRSRYNKVVTIFTMEADRLSGGMAPLIFKLVSIWMWVVRLSALATIMPEKKLWFSLSWRLDGHWSWPGCFGEKIVFLLHPRSEPQILQHIS